MSIVRQLSEADALPGAGRITRAMMKELNALHALSRKKQGAWLHSPGTQTASASRGCSPEKPSR